MYGTVNKGVQSYSNFLKNIIIIVIISFFPKFAYYTNIMKDYNLDRILVPAVKLFMTYNYERVSTSLLEQATGLTS